MTVLTIRLDIFVIGTLLYLSGCVSSKPPTIAHTHIGHTMTAWADTPGQQGLFITAENAAQAAHQAASRAAAQDIDLAAIKADVREAVGATDSVRSEDSVENDQVQYGVRNALSAADHHISFAANSPDASENVRASASIFSRHARVVLDRCDLVLALGNDILASSSPEEAELLAGELVKLTNANISGEDTDGDGLVGSISEEYGLKQLRTELEAMIDREDPAYRTVDNWYLFNLVRLPGGDWVFRRFSSGGAGSGGTSY